MSDYVSNSEQIAEITAAAEQPSSSPASPNSTNLLDSAENATQGNAWPPLEVTDYSLKEWLNSNNKPSCELSTAEEITSQDSDLATPLAAPRTPSIHRDPLRSLALTNSADRDSFQAHTLNKQDHLRHRTTKMKTRPNKSKITHCGTSSKRPHQEA